MKIDVTVQSRVADSVRVQQLSAMFDVPPQETSTLTWTGELPIEGLEWNVGAIIGPSGCGKSTIKRALFDEDRSYAWGAESVIDDFSAELSMADITAVCQAVGFNTIPAWMRPYHVLSNGERFRVELARALLEGGDPIVVDEFTSVVDRQVAKIGSHAVQKYVRRTDKRFVAVSCHHDIVEWLQPDWVFEPATMTFTRRLLRRRPEINAEVRRVPYDAWRLFAPYHYLTAELHRAARCFGLFVDGRIAAFAGMLNRPHAKVDNIIGCSRLVTLPDWQGLGLAMVLIETIGAAYRAHNKQVRTYPAHPALVRSFAKSDHWSMEKRAGQFSPRAGRTSAISSNSGFGGRPCGVFRYVGPTMDKLEAEQFLCGAYV